MSDGMNFIFWIGVVPFVALFLFLGLVSYSESGRGPRALQRLATGLLNAIWIGINIAYGLLILFVLHTLFTA